MDDRPENLLALEAILDAPGLTLVRATSGDEALRRVLAIDFAAIVLDVQMPGLSGFEVARLIRGRPRTRHTPIIFLTATTHEEFPVEEAYALGAVDYLVKPVSPVVLRAKLAVFVDLYRRTREASAVERQRADATQARLAAIVESSDDAIIGKDLDGTIQFWNGGAERVFGYAAAEAVGRSITFVVPADRLEEERGILERLRRGERIAHFETQRVAKDGSLIDISLTISPIRGPDGRIIGASKVARDVTHLKAGERALAEARRRSETALQAGEVGTYYWDLSTDRVTGDRNFVAIFGVLTDVHASAPVADYLAVIHPDDRERVIREIRQTLDTDAAFRCEYRISTPDGERWLLARGAVERDAAGGPVGWAGVVADISNRKVAERKLAESEERFRSLFESMDEGYCVVEPVFDSAGKPVDYRYLLANPALESHTGLTDVVGKTARQVMPGHESHWIEAYARVATTGETFRRTDFVADLGRWYEVSAFRVGDPGGRQVGVLFADVTARVRAEEAVQASERQLAEVFQHAPSFMAVLRGPDHVFVRANDHYRQLVGGRDVVGKAVVDALPEVVGQGFVQLLDRVYRTGEAHVGTGERVLLQSSHGRPMESRYLDFVYQPLRDAGGTVTGILVQGIDQTERKRAEDLLRQKDERLQLLVEQARDYAVVITNRDGQVIEWAGGAAGITGFSASDVVGQPIDVLFTPEDRMAELPTKERATAAREGRAEDKRWHVRKDGTQFFADGVMVPLRGDDGTLHGFGKVFRDVTGRKRADDSVRFLADASASLAELVDYQSTLRRVANLAVGGFADWCVVDLLNEGKRERLAVTTTEPEEVTAARTADAVFRPDDGGGGVIPHVLRTGEPEVVHDLAETDLATAPQGPERLGKLRSMGIRSYLCVPLLSRGRVIGGMTFLSSSPRRLFGPDELRVAQSLAERVTVAIENARLYLALQEQDRRKDEFLATLAHELRNPLAPVRNGVQILRMGGTTGEAARRALAMMDRQLGHVTHLVDDLMDVARVSSGKVVLRKERVELRGVVDAAVETSRQAIEACGHELALRVPVEPLTLEADRTRLVQVMANLLNNAAKYTPAGGQIVLSVASQTGIAVVRVTDTGVGIPEDMLPRVFDLFTQVGTSLERSQGGLGIGLTLVKRLVEMHGGSVSADSPGVGKGSTFTVKLPLAGESPVPSETSRGTSDVPAANAPLDILIVDDNRDSAESLAMLLELRGHQVRTAHDGPETLRLLGAYRPHLILLDLGLPGMSGYEVAHRIRESGDHRDVMIAALTGWGQEEDRRRTREAGFDYHLVKPADPLEMERILAAVQGRR